MVAVVEMDGMAAVAKMAAAAEMVAAEELAVATIPPRPPSPIAFLSLIVIIPYSPPRLAKEFVPMAGHKLSCLARALLVPSSCPGIDKTCFLNILKFEHCSCPGFEKIFKNVFSKVRA